MKVLLIKTSSLGDVIHALPAVTEAARNNPAIEFTWVVEEALSEIPVMHPAVKRVIPIAIRRWRRSLWSSRAEIKASINELKDTQYDLVIDSQGLLKSGLLTGLSRGERHGYDSRSARESLASLFYKHAHAIDPDQHAVQRQKQLLAASLRYESNPEVDYGLSQTRSPEKCVMFLHGTTWRSKEWPEHCWQALANLAAADGYELLLPAGNEAEQQTAASILGDRSGEVLFGQTISDLSSAMRRCSGVVTVDTGLGHLAAGFGLPVVGLFGSTDPGLTAMNGPEVELIVSDHLPCIPCKKRTCSFPIEPDSSSIYPPCFAQTTPERVWQALQLQIGSKDTKPD